MAMDWSSERYVRLYTRDTLTWRRWCWQARAVFPLLLRAADRAGLLHVGSDPGEGLALVVGLPAEVCVVALHGDRKTPGLLSPDGDGGPPTVVLRGGLLIIPNHIAAQEAQRTDAQRQRDHRERVRDIASGARLLLDSRKVPELGPSMSHAVTPGHAVTVSVTPSLAEPPEEEGTPPATRVPPQGGKRRRSTREPDGELQPIVDRVVERLNQRSATPFDPRGKTTRSRIEGLLRAGHTEADLRLVVWHRHVEWGADPAMRKYLRPSTVFGPTKFEEYLPMAVAAWRAKNGGELPAGVSDKVRRLAVAPAGGARTSPGQPSLLEALTKDTKHEP